MEQSFQRAYTSFIFDDCRAFSIVSLVQRALNDRNLFDSRDDLSVMRPCCQRFVFYILYISLILSSLQRGIVQLFIVLQVFFQFHRSFIDRNVLMALLFAMCTDCPLSIDLKFGYAEHAETADFCMSCLRLRQDGAVRNESVQVRIFCHVRALYSSLECRNNPQDGFFRSSHQ